MNNAANIFITKDAYDEYRVPSPDDTEAGAYYTDDRADALDTANAMYKAFGFDAVKVKFRRVEEHPTGR